MRKIASKELGIFSLVAFFLLGIFFPPAHAAKTVRIDITATQTFATTFSFNTGETAKRATFPDRAYFNASGTLFQTSPIPTHVSDFPDWITNYTTQTWTSVKSETDGSFYEQSMQVQQIPTDSNMGLAAGTIFVSKIQFFSPYSLILNAYSSEGNFLATPIAGFPKTVATNNRTKPHSLIVTKNRAYFFWLSNDDKIHYKNFDGTNFSSEITFTNPDTHAPIGLSGCKIDSGIDEYVAFTYAKSATTTAIVTFKEGNFPVTATTTVELGDISSRHVDICQNPRTGDVYLTWINGDIAYYKKCQFTAPSTWNIGATTAITGSWATNYGVSVEGFANFETSFAFPSPLAADNVVKDVLLRSSTTINNSFTPNTGFACLFPYRNNGVEHAGLVILSGFTNFKFYKRPLTFPKDLKWEIGNKTLHIEGPPKLNTDVSIEVDYAELATSSCLAQAVNTGGGRKAFNGASNIIASAGNLISLTFDKNMKQADYPGLINNKIKLFAADNSQIPLSYDSGDSRAINFKPNIDLALDSTYRISLASDVYDSIGSQIWSVATLTFSTQKSQSYALASEVISISAYKDAARTQLIANNSEVNASATIYLKMNSVDPAFNTIDVATISVYLDGAFVQQIQTKQPVASTNEFLGQYTLSSPGTGSHTYEFRTPNVSISQRNFVQYPYITIINPSNGSTNQAINTNPTITFNENILASSVNTSNIRLTRGGTNANFSVSVTGNVITINPNDTSESYLRTGTTYTIGIGNKVKDLLGNPFVNTPATYTSSFTTQASQTRPLSVSQVKLFSDSGYSTQLAQNSDYPRTGTLYLELTGADGSNLTKDYALASISTGATAYLTETASFTGIYRGSTSFSNLSDDFVLKVQSLKSPAASASLLITYPEASPISPASNAVAVPLNSTITVQADESIDPATINAANVKLQLEGVNVDVTRSYNPVSKIISLAPTALLQSQKVYTVLITNLKDINGNPQAKDLIYKFETVDIIPPTISSFYPSNGAVGVTIDRHIVINFSESMLASSANNSTIKLSRGGNPASYSVIVSGSKITIDPDDAPESQLKTATSYLLEIGPSVTDLAGNGLSNVPATFTLNFSTQPRYADPVSIDSLNLFKDGLLTIGWSMNEKVPNASTIYLKITGTDGATQTKDLATVTLDLSWGGNKTIVLTETASNSSGLYTGVFNLASIPISDFPTPLPPVKVGTMTWKAVSNPSKVATLTISYPTLDDPNSSIQTISGASTASGAANVRVDSTITTAFSETLQSAGNTTNFSFSIAGVPLAGARTLSADKKHITFAPDADLPYSSKIDVFANYSNAGLKSQIGNALYRPIKYSFTTQAAQTAPGAITSVELFPNNSFNALEAYAENSDFLSSGTIYIEFTGNDSSANTIDKTSASISTGASVSLTETSANSGIFRGSYTYPSLADGQILKVNSAVTPTSNRTLLLSIPDLALDSPASGSTGVSVFTSINVTSDEALDSNSINSATVKLLKSDNSLISSSITYDSVSHTIGITPTAQLDFSSNYRIEIKNTKDLVGNPQKASLISSFQTQATSIAPAIITDFKIYSDNLYTTAIPNNSFRIPSSNVYLQITATDLSPTTTDSTAVSIISDKTTATASIVLIETGVNSGIFRSSTQLFAQENATLTFSSVTDPAFTSNVRTYQFPRFTSLQPASGSSGIYLNTSFILKSNKAFSPGSISTSSIKLADKNGLASYSLVLNNPTELVIKSELASGSKVNLHTNSLLLDTDGISFAPLIASFTTLTPVYSNFRLFKDAANTQELFNGANVEANQTIYASLTGTDAKQAIAETIQATFYTDLSTSTFTLTETTTGLFKGNFNVPNETDKPLNLYPDVNNSLKRNLQILPLFAISSFSPASGALAVPADTWPSWNFTRPIATSSINLTKFKLLKVNSGLQVPGTLSVSPTRKQIRFQPDNIFALLTDYEMHADSTIEDTAGNLLGVSLTTRFTTQPPPAPPTIIDSLRNFESTQYATSTLSVANNGILYLELVANDMSFSTYDTARIRIDSSDGSIDGDEVTLVEIAPPSGVYRLAYPINLPVGTRINIQSQVNTSFKLDIKVSARTRLVSVSPASASTNLFLDEKIILNFSQAINPLDLPQGVTGNSTSNLNIPLTFNPINSNRSVEITPTSSWATGTTNHIAISTSLHDQNGLFLLPEKSSFITRAATFSSLQAFTGIPPLDKQNILTTKEATMLQIEFIASTTNLFNTYPERRNLTISVSGTNIPVALTETSTAGVFSSIASYSLPENSFATATLNFGTNPQINFKIAQLPQLNSIFPASGSKNISDTVTIRTEFSRIMSAQNSSTTLEIVTPNGNIQGILTNATDSTNLNWQVSQALPPAASCSLRFSNVTDYLGQPVTIPEIKFSTGGQKGICLYQDSNYNLKITGDTILTSSAYLEIGASSSAITNTVPQFVDIRTGRATETKKLELERVTPTSAKFRCSFDFATSKAPPQHIVSLIPGEWIEFSAPQLTNETKRFYYRVNGSQNPAKVSELNLYSEKYFAQQIFHTFRQPTLYIEAICEDQNWFTQDSTMVRVTSDSDRTGFRLILNENGNHSDSFRNAIKVNLVNSYPAQGLLKVLPGENVYIYSETDPSIKTSVKYLPENSMDRIFVYPSPARGNQVTFSFYLTFPGWIELEIFDTAGDEVFSTNIRGLEGENRYVWRFPRHLANGVYFYKMKLETETAYPTRKQKGRGKFAVLR